MIPKISFSLLALGSASAALSACPKCRPLVEAGVHNTQFMPHLGLLMLPLGLLCIVALAAYNWK